MVSIRSRSTALRRQGRSIGEIARVLRVSKSTVHWHVKNIRLTDAHRARLRADKHQLMIKVNARRRGIPVHPFIFKKPAWSGSLVRLIAHLSFDGRVDRYGCHYYNRSYSQILSVKRLLESLLGITPSIKQRSNGIWVVSCYNVAVATWLSSREIQLLSVIRRRTDWQRQWLQALFDDEGHIHASGTTRRVRASQKSLEVLEHAQRFLQTIAIGSRIDRCAWAVEITGRANLEAFKSLIGFSQGISINANRKNGCWDQPFEKRALLDVALSSYKRPLVLS